jgi:outer membrane protein assembly factor BamD
LSWLRRNNRFILICAAAAVLAASCGGPYKARRIELPDQKLALADELFERGKYDRSAVEYKDFLATFAGDERSDYAQFRLAESYRLDEQYAVAAVEYRILVSDYGYSDYVDDAFFLEGVCAFKQTNRPERDQTKSYEALNRINRFLQIFPSSPRREEAEEIRIKIHDQLGKKDFLNAKLYFSMHRDGAALIYFDKIIASYPSTVWAQRSHYYRGLIMKNRGNREEAVKSFEIALREPARLPEREEAARALESLQGDGGNGE